MDRIRVHWLAQPTIRSWMQSKNEHFTFLAGDGWRMGLESIDQPGQSSEGECNPKMSISLFWLERGGGQGSSPSTSPADHQKLNVIQKWAFHIFGWEKGGGWGLSPSTSPADYQKLNAIQKWAFHFFGWRWVADGVWVHPPAWLIIRRVNLIQKWAFHFFGWRGVADGVQVHWPAQPIIRSWMQSKNEHFIFLAGEGWWTGFESID